MPEKPRDRPPARSHKSQTQDRANSAVQTHITPPLLGSLYKTGRPAMVKAIMASLADKGTTNGR